jgi:NADH-quinone oxidoreductase subunit L
MDNMIALIPAIPLTGFLIITFFGSVLKSKGISRVAVGSVFLSALITLITSIDFLNSEGSSKVITTQAYTWINAGSFRADIALRMDSLSLIFCFVITFVGFLIHLYSVEFMKDEEGFQRFFAYMNLFIASMLILVQADNLLLLYLGWEGVGLCSYLLIGFWYKDPANGYAARKAFIVTRVGDTFLLIGMFLLFVSFGTLQIDNLQELAQIKWQSGTPLANIAALLLLGGAVGKSAQLPMQTWLPDAMAGPSPVSALIHAATMVTAGVYLIARMNILFSLAPLVQSLIAIIGAITLLMAGFSALTQHDLKRVLAYSTISQIGYMFLALGVGAWSAAIFHFMIHAFFKALLFLAAGSIILLLHEEHDMYKMGGLRKKLPVIYFTFLIGGASLSALPLITAGFYSKDQILWLSWASEKGSQWLWMAAIAGAFITSLYTFRMIFLTFFGESKTEPAHKPGPVTTVPLIILAILSLAGGFVQMPENISHFQFVTTFLKNTLPVTSLHTNEINEWIFQVISGVISIAGVLLAYHFFIKKAFLSNNHILQFFSRGWDFDALYDRLFVRPFVWLAVKNKNDIVDKVYGFIATGTSYFNSILSTSQNGRLRWYAVIFTTGIAVILIIMMVV